MARGRNTETDAYQFIKDTLHGLGWNTKNPTRHPDGQVYTQNECFGNPEIQRWLGRETPENIVRISESRLWVIEAKKEHKQLSQAVSEARDYASKINKGTSQKAVLITGVAGNFTDSFLMESELLVGSKWQDVRINRKKASSLLKPAEVRILLDSGSPEILDIIIDERLFLEKAEAINEILHLGAINKNVRAKVMAALLLSLVDDTPPNIDANPRGLIRDINTRVQNVLESQGKEEFAELITIALPPSTDNHVKFKKALVDTIQQLNILNIRSAMNSGTDVLGRFYEVFLKYGNGAKEIGIVLTPRHVTKWAVDTVGVSPSDFIYDPTCGTGGFLVAAFDQIKPVSSQPQITEFKRHHLFGVEQEPEVVALAIVNMIFRGDGKNNIIEGNCLQKSLVKRKFGRVDSARFAGPTDDADRVISRVLMNPPFALENSDEREYKFVQHALDQMIHGGILFSVLPMSVMCESGDNKIWRMKRLLVENTLLSVVSFPIDLFYPIGVHTVGVFVRKGIPHEPDRNVLWCRCDRDGFVKSKGKRLPSEKEPNLLDTVKPTLRAFLVDHSFPVKSVPMYIKAAPVNYDDPLLELLPEAYLDNRDLATGELQSEIDVLLREQAAMMIRFGREAREN